jgi:hypothetical protein
LYEPPQKSAGSFKRACLAPPQTKTTTTNQLTQQKNQIESPNKAFQHNKQQPPKLNCLPNKTNFNFDVGNGEARFADLEKFQQGWGGSRSSR